MEGREGKGYRIYLSTIFFFLRFYLFSQFRESGRVGAGGAGSWKESQEDAELSTELHHLHDPSQNRESGTSPTEPRRRASLKHHFNRTLPKKKITTLPLSASCCVK